MLHSQLLAELSEAAESACHGRGPAHDFSHVRRVVAAARSIAEAEGADLEVVTLAALLHELFNYPKDHPRSADSGRVCAERAGELLVGRGLDGRLIEEVCAAIRDHAYSQGAAPGSLASQVLQDADRLDAIGAIGVARWAATCAEMRRPFYHPGDPLCRRREADDKRWGLDHFHRKLLRIPEGLHTAAARSLAESRLCFLRRFLAQLERELGELGVGSAPGG